MTRLATSLAFGVAACLGLVEATGAPDRDPAAARIGASTRAAVIDGIIREFDPSYVIVEKTKDVEKRLRARAKGGTYEPLADGSALAEALSADLREVTGDAPCQAPDLRRAGGRLVRELADRDFEAGRYGVHWDGRDGSGTRVASGAYFVRLEAGELRQVRKIVRVD